MREYAWFDQLIIGFDLALRATISPVSRECKRENPANQVAEQALSADQKKHISGLMRVNHSGEVCAQALYQGQGLTAKLTTVKQQMLEAAEEEIDHLAWCEQRLHELDSQPSILNPLWYWGSFLIGALAGLAGDSISLGFVAETENQVSEHLRKHLAKLPATDQKTKVLLEQMYEDEMLHAETARQAGAIDLAPVIKKVMENVSKIMTTTSYYL